MSAIRDRLRILQRQIGHAPARDALPEIRDVRSELRRLLRARERAAVRSLAPPAGLEIDKGVWLVESSVSWHYETPALPMPWGEPDPIARDRIVCFDTETTGLAGGVGTKAFMIGTAQWDGAAVRTRQWYLTALAGEAAMLRAFERSLPRDPVFVSYNGRSYDAPLLRGRYRMHRLQASLAEHRHVDLLYPTRRRYRGRWENCRLQTIERNVLGVVREDDLPGSEAPGAWLAFLRGQASEPLRRVLVHNAQDVRTLAMLLEHLAEIVVSDGANVSESRVEAIGRLAVG